MNVDVVNSQNEKVGSIELSDELFGGRPATHLVWESVVHTNAGERRGTHATKSRGLVSGTGKKPWKQKGTGRARVGDSRNPLWRKGGTVFGPQPRSYEFRLPKKVVKGALRAAIAAKLAEQALLVVEQLAVETVKTKGGVELLRRLGVGKKSLLVDLKADDKLALSVRNIEGVRLVESNRLTARDVADGGTVVMTRAAIERLQEVLG